MAQLVKVFFPYDPLPAQDLNDIVGFLNGVAAGTNLEPASVTSDKIDSESVFASGTNSNGAWIKFPDGTMMCWIGRLQTTYGSTQHTAATWTFPQEFIESPDISATIDESSASGVTVASIRYAQGISSQLDGTSAQIRVRCNAGSVSNPASIYVWSQAFGRWK